MDEKEARIRTLFVESLSAWQKLKLAQKEFFDLASEDCDFSEKELKEMKDSMLRNLPKDPEELTHSKKDEAWGNIKKKFDFKFE